MVSQMKAAGGLIAAACFVLAVCVSAQATESKDVDRRMDVKGFALGTSLAVVRRTIKVNCRRDESGRHDTVCEYVKASERVFAGERALEIKFEFFGDKLDGVTILLPGDAYSSMKQAMDQKFGPATPRPNLNGLCDYYRNGDRGQVMFLDSNLTYVVFESGDGTAERDRRAARARQAIKDSM